jgi:ribonucleoside-diphosphate reductase beta chain
VDRSITHNARTGYASLAPGGLNYDNFPMKLFAKGNKKFWNPADIDFSQDAADFAAMTEAEKRMTMILAAQFIGGEESVTQDMQPFCSAMAAEGRLGDEMYLTQFIFEEAKHTDGFRRFFDAIGMRDVDLHEYVEYSDSYRQIFLEELPRSMYALADDPSPANQVRASVTYNHVVEGCLALTGYFAWAKVCESRNILPGMSTLVRRIGDDERRHMAWGTFTCRRHIAADDSNWNVVDERMQELLTPALGLIVGLFDAFGDNIPFGINLDEMTDYALDKVNRRLESIESARGQDPAAIDLDHSPSDLEELFNAEDRKLIDASVARQRELANA